jgi:hypothetical protein
MSEISSPPLATAQIGASVAGTRQTALRPNPSFNRTRYGRRRKAGAQRLRHCRAPALHRPPPQAGYLER